jgi:hypothetical protein
LLKDKEIIGVGITKGWANKNNTIKLLAVKSIGVYSLQVKHFCLQSFIIADIFW